MISSTSGVDQFDLWEARSFTNRSICEMRRRDDEPRSDQRHCLSINQKEDHPVWTVREFTGMEFRAETRSRENVFRKFCLNRPFTLWVTRWTKSERVRNNPRVKCKERVFKSKTARVYERLKRTRSRLSVELYPGWLALTSSRSNARLFPYSGLFRPADYFEHIRYYSLQVSRDGS